MGCYLNIVQMGRRGTAPDKQRIETMSALTQLGRIFDASVAVAFVFLTLSLAGATAAVGA